MIEWQNDASGRVYYEIVADTEAEALGEVRRRFAGTRGAQTLEIEVAR
jgi:hypothetical protein